MYRPLVPPALNSRVVELLDAVKNEFDTIGQEVSVFKMHKDDYDHKISSQIQEMQSIRQTVYELEMTLQKMKQQYEDEVARLRRELDSARSDQQGSGGGGGGATTTTTTTSPSQTALQPPSLGGSSALFGGATNGDNLSNHTAAAAATTKRGRETPLPGVGGGAVSPSQQQQQQQQKRSKLPSTTPSSTAAPLIAPSTQQQQQQTAQSLVPTPSAPPTTHATTVTPSLSDTDPDTVSRDLKKEGDDWFAIFNANIKPRQLDVSLIHTFEHTSVVCCVRFSADGKYVATGCNRSAQIFDVQTGQPVCILQDESVQRPGDLYIRSVCFSPDGKYLATGAEDKQIRIWDIQKKRIRHLFTGHEQDIYSLDFSRSGRLIASGSGDRTARVWDMESGQCVLTLSIEDGVTTVAISPDGKYVAAGSLDRVVRVWDAQTGYLVERLEGHRDSVYSVAFSPNGMDLLSGSLDKTIKLWELSAPRGLAASSVKGGVCKTTLVGHKDFVLSVALSPDGQWIVSGSKDRGVQFWDPRTAQPQFMLQGHKNSGWGFSLLKAAANFCIVISVALSPSSAGKLFATGSGDFRARIWSYDTNGRQ